MVPPDTRHDPPAAAAGQAASLQGMVRLTCGLAAAHRAVDLAGLDDRVGLLCARALDLQPAEGRALRPQLVSLLDALDELATVLQP